MIYRIKIIQQICNPLLIGMLVYKEQDKYQVGTHKILCTLNANNQYSFFRIHTYNIQLIKYLIENNIIKLISTNSEMYEYCLTETVLLSLL
jgi:hypothetical protein